MKNLTLSKKLVLTALAREPLISQHFVQYGRHGKKDCRVCAVGSVLRTVGIRDGAIDDVADLCVGTSIGSEKELKAALDTKDYLSALSIKFEGLARKFRWFLDKEEGREYSLPVDCYSYESLRPAMIRFAEQEIPMGWKMRIPVPASYLKRKRKKVA